MSKDFGAATSKAITRGLWGAVLGTGVALLIGMPLGWVPVIAVLAGLVAALPDSGRNLMMPQSIRYNK